MSLTSTHFLLFALLLLVVFYAIPRKCQWCVLLLFSLAFYCMAGLKNVIYILITAGTTFLSAQAMERWAEKQKRYLKEHPDLSKEEKGTYKKQIAARRKWLLVCTLVLNFGILCVFKYTNFVLAQVNGIIQRLGTAGPVDSIRFIVPLGISFYTFQTMGYLIDVYWKKIPAQQNPAKLLLFVSFFPQITQGPISDYQQLSAELFSEHVFQYENIKNGGERMIWGFAKKIILADLLAPCVSSVFSNYSTYTGITVLIGAFFYSVQIYADFSGYMDIVCGLCEMLGIRLRENFNRPYFSKSIAEYWRRWHISLGDWFKTYIYYPIAVAKWNQKLGKKAQTRFGKHIGQTIPASIALVVVWLTTGLWHGASWGYIAWGGVNGLFIIFSLWMEPVYDSWKKGLRINDSSWSWRAFQTVRTFLLVTFIKVLPEVGTLRDGLGLWKQIFTNHVIPRSYYELFPFVNLRNLTVIVLFTVLLFVTSLIQRKQPIRRWFEKLPKIVQFVSLALLILVTFFYGSADTAGGFMYAQF